MTKYALMKKYWNIFKKQIFCLEHMNKFGKKNPSSFMESIKLFRSLNFQNLFMINTSKESNAK